MQADPLSISRHGRNFGGSIWFHRSKEYPQLLVADSRVLRSRPRPLRYRHDRESWNLKLRHPLSRGYDNWSAEHVWSRSLLQTGDAVLMCVATHPVSKIFLRDVFESDLEAGGGPGRDHQPRAFRFHNRAEAYQGLGDITRGIADYDETIRPDPVKRWFRFLARGNALRKAGQHIRAWLITRPL
jgi:hypothetical protein